MARQTAPRNWTEVPGHIGAFAWRVTVGEIYRLRVFGFFGEALRQAGLLITSSALVILGLVFLLGMSCGLESAYFSRAFGAPSLSGAFAAWCNLRELAPLAFGYMMAAKVGTGIAAELGAMRIDDEIDAVEVMGINSVAYLAATRLLASWMVLPLLFVVAVGGGFLASWLVVIHQVGDTSSGAYLLVFWQFQNPLDFLYAGIKAMLIATAVVLVGCYYGYHAAGGPVGVGTATARSMVLNIVLVHTINALGTSVFWGKTPRAPLGG